MYLKRLELVGFKSFVDKTIFDFPGGIAAIVGPNGSGKTNVVEAIRWILGEREAKNLRGNKAEDLIFVGTPKRPRVGMAQVSITFDNSSGFFPVDYKEVAVTRRIDRSGNSQYFLNKAEVRLKDIIDFFAKVRLGSRGLSIINQGASDLFVRVTPQERRAMIEEILGLRQYQLKKHEAQRKLKNTAINIEKVRAMIEEIIPHLRFLKRQTAKWQKLDDLSRVLEEGENAYFANKFHEIQKEFKDLEPKIQEIDKEIAVKNKELDELKAVLKKVETGQPVQGSRVSEIRERRELLFQERSNIEKEIGRLEAKIEFLHSVVASEKVDFRAGELLAVLGEAKEIIVSLKAEENLEKIYEGLEILFNKITSVTDINSKQKNEIDGLRSSRDILLKNSQLVIQSLKELSATEEEATKEFEHFNKEFRQVFEKLEAKKEEISGLINNKNKILLEVERWNIQKQDWENKVSQTGRDKKALESLAKNPPPVDDLAGLEYRMLKLRSEIASIGEIDQVLIKEARETEDRHNFLAVQLEDLEKAAADLQRLIDELSEKIDIEFHESLKKINEEFGKFLNLMFGGGKAKLVLEKPSGRKPEEEETMEPELQEHQKELEEDELSKQSGIEIELSLVRKKISGLDMLSGGEKSLVSIAALFALISVSPPPFLVLDEIDAALDEKNTKRFADIVSDFSQKTQFIIITHNRATMEAANVLYGITMEEDGVSKVLSLKLEG